MKVMSDLYAYAYLKITHLTHPNVVKLPNGAISVNPKSNKVTIKLRKKLETGGF